MSRVNILIIGLSDDFLVLVRRALARVENLVINTRLDTLASLVEFGAMPPDILLIQDACKHPEKFGVLGTFSQRYPNSVIAMICQSKDPDVMVQALRAGVKEFLFEPVQESEITAMVMRLAAIQQAGHSHAAPCEVMAFIACKGGSGATFIATNLAHILSQENGKRVLLIDLNLQFGDAYLFLMDHLPPSTLAEVCLGFNRLDGAFLESACTKLPSGLFFLPAPRSPVDAESVKPEHIEAIIALARTRYDFVVLDMNRMLDSVTLKALDLADHIYPVLQLTVPYLDKAKRMKEIFHELNYSENKVRWIVNRYGTEEELNITDANQILAEAFWKVPNDHRHVSLSVNQGIPIVQLAPKSPCAKSLSEWAASMLSVAEKPHTGLLGRIFGH